MKDKEGRRRSRANRVGGYVFATDRLPHVAAHWQARPRRAIARLRYGLRRGCRGSLGVSEALTFSGDRRRGDARLTKLAIAAWDRLPGKRCDNLQP